MPGLYIQDGGQTASALGNAIGQLADNLSPEGRARASLLYQQTQGADIANERAYTQQYLDAQAARQSAGILATGGADAQPPGGVPGAVASLAEPPMTPGPGGRYPLLSTSGMTPNQTYMAGRLFTGMSPSDLTTAINLGRNENLGPGQDFTTQNAIAQAKAVPYDLTAGTTRHVPGGALPETTVSGGDAGQAEAQKASLLSTQKDADSRAALAEAATNTQNDLIQAKQLYNSLVGATDVRSVIGDGMVNWLAEKTGLSIQQLSDPAQARLAIKAMLKTSIGSALAAVQGDPNAGPIRGILQQTNASMPDPDTMNDTQFNAGIDRMLKVTARQMSYGAPARTFKLSGQAKADADAYNQQLEAIRARQEAENAAEASAGAGDGSGGGQVYVFPDEATMEAAGAAGNLPDGARIQLGYGPKAMTGRYKK